MSAKAELAAYWQESASWDRDRVRQWREAASTWRWVALGGWCCTIACAVALAAMSPLKRVEPFVIRVDNSTGIVDVVPQYTGTQDLPQLVTRYLLTHYVTVCERFNFETVESDYAECGAFHTAQRNQAWYAQWKRSNPASPLNLFRDGTTVRAEVTSVTFLKAEGTRGLAQIRFVHRLRQAPDAAEQVTHWIAVVQYEYSTPAREPRSRALNPLGLRISDYRIEQEAPSEPAAVPIPTATAMGAKP